MKATGHLIKVAQEGTDSGTIADIAAEVAAEAVARSQHIQQETQKLSKKIESQPKRGDDEASLHGVALQDPDADIQDIRKRSIHHLDISDRLPWLKETQLRIEEEHEDDEQGQRDRDRLTSPDSGVIDHLSEATESSDGHMSIHSVSSPPHSALRRQESAEDEDILVPPPNPDNDYHFQAHLKNSEMVSSLELPSLDYPILPPPKDYPSFGQHLAPPPRTVDPHPDSNPAGDAYTVQEAKTNADRTKRFRSNTTSSSTSQLRSTTGAGQLGSKSTSNLLNVR